MEKNFFLNKGKKKSLSWAFPVASVVKNLPANAGDMGSIPDWGRSHMPQEQLSLWVATIEPVF